MPRQFLNAVLPVLSANAEHDRGFTGLDLYQRVTEGQPRDWEWRAIAERRAELGTLGPWTLGMPHARLMLWKHVPSAGRRRADRR